MKSDFLLAITQLSAEKNLPSEVVISAVEAALASAYRKDNFTAQQNISVKISPNSGRVQVWAEKTVVEKPSDTRSEISLEEACRIKPDVQIGEAVMVEATPSNAGRIAAQTAKQVILLPAWCSVLNSGRSLLIWVELKRYCPYQSRYPRNDTALARG
jgi:N utilization substance protein A